MSLTPEEEAYLSSIYYDPEHAGSFSGENKLYRVIKEEGRFRISHKKLKQWLSSQETYTLHRQARRRYPRRRVIVGNPGKQADADLMDMSHLSTHNNGIHFILLLIDDFSRKVWTYPLKTKTGAALVKAFADIFQRGGKTQIIRTDRGTEFTNKQVQQYFRKEGVHHFVSENPSTKASIAERAIKTLKMRLYRYMNQFQTFKYIVALQKVTKSYNETFHRSIKMKPSQVTEDNISEVFKNLYPSKAIALKKPKFKIKVGDWVRISNLQKTFSREYDERWSTETFQVVEAQIKQDRPSYSIQDYLGEKVTGTFYPEELQVIRVPDNAVYRVERVIKSRKLKNRPKEYLIKWLGLGNQFNSWVTEEDLKDLPKPPE